MAKHAPAIREASAQPIGKSLIATDNYLIPMAGRLLQYDLNQSMRILSISIGNANGIMAPG